MIYRWFYISEQHVCSLGPMSMQKAREYEESHPMHTPIYTVGGLEMLRDEINYQLRLPKNAAQRGRD